MQKKVDISIRQRVETGCYGLLRRVGTNAVLYSKLDGQRDDKETFADRAEHDRTVGHRHVLRAGRIDDSGRRRAAAQVVSGRHQLRGSQYPVSRDRRATAHLDDE